MSEQDKKWLEEEFPQHYGKTIKGATYHAYLEAERILKGRAEQTPRGCSCRYNSLGIEVNNSYSKWLQSNGKELL